MSRFIVVTGELAGGKVGLTLVCGTVLAQRHAEVCRPGLWAIRHFEVTNHRTTPTAQAVMDDFGTLREVTR